MMRSPRENQYAHAEWERRFLVARFPDDANVTRVRHIVDRYIDGTHLRLRRQNVEGHDEFKLTQKISETKTGPRQGLVTTMYLTEQEFCVLEKLPAKLLTKKRYSVPPFGIDIFEGELRGLVLAEAEFSGAEEASSLTLPSFVVHEVTDDIRFTGGELVRASRLELEEWLEEFRMEL